MIWCVPTASKRKFGCCDVCTNRPTKGERIMEDRITDLYEQMNRVAYELGRAGMLLKMLVESMELVSAKEPPHQLRRTYTVRESLVVSAKEWVEENKDFY